MPTCSTLSVVVLYSSATVECSSLPPDPASASLAEATHVEKIVTHFLRSGVTPAQIGIITPYEGQVGDTGGEVLSGQHRLAQLTAGLASVAAVAGGVLC